MDNKQFKTIQSQLSEVQHEMYILKQKEETLKNEFIKELKSMAFNQGIDDFEVEFYKEYGVIMGSAKQDKCICIMLQNPSVDEIINSIATGEL